jgi:predicted aldo/keto reductase-like oxidoreductase
MEDNMKRRVFIMAGLAGGAALSAFSCMKRAKSRNEPLPRRSLGRTGESLSIIGFGGIVVMDEEPRTAARMVADAVEHGVNYFDVAPSYGNAQEKLGPALEPFRKNCFLACKTTEREKAGAEKELNESLKILRTDHVDLYQLHAISSLEDVEKAFGPGGAMEVFLKARQEGKTRFLGFSAHSEEAAFAAMDRFAFDTILFPVNFACWFGGNFGPQVLARAGEKGMGILALKAMAHSAVREGESKPYKKCWYRPIEDFQLQALALRFTLSQGVTAAIPPGEPGFFQRALEIARDATPITEKEIALLANRAKTVEPVFKKA